MDKQNAQTEALAALGLMVNATFVPWSRAKRREQDDGKDVTKRAIYWDVTIKHNERAILTTQYSQGIGHLPKHLQVPWNHGVSMLLASAIEQATETGKARLKIDSAWPTKDLEPPTPEDVMYSIGIDTCVLDYATFEDWAYDFGYDPDSRKAESIYQECLAIALKLRAAIGDEGIQRLSNAFQGY